MKPTPWLALIFALMLAQPVWGQRPARPNILWIVIEDMSPHMGCYGETTIKTPHIDSLAADGVKFTNAYVTAPVCSTCRSALLTGMYQTSIGAHHHRSGRGELKISLPENVKLIPEYFREAGYWTCNLMSPEGGKKIGKTDYNFEWDPAVYDGGDWSGRAFDQPFFAQIQLHGGKYRGGNNWTKRVEEKLGSVTDPDDVNLPPYYPDDPVIRDDWAAYLDTVRWTDWEVGQILSRLKEEQILDRTVIFLITDHGISHARGKQFCYQEGIRIPLLIHGPEMIGRARIREDLVLQIDLAATSLALAGIDLPEHLQSVDLLADDYQPREYVVSARDRCDETVDRIRSVTNGRFKLIRNFYPARPYLQPNAYKDSKGILIRIREMAAAGQLNEIQSLVTADSRPPLELYDLQNDPWEIHNLAESPYYRDVVRRMSDEFGDWIERTGDRGERPEGAMYDSDMEVYLNTISRRLPERAETIRSNIELMKKWASEGK